MVQECGLALGGYALWTRSEQVTDRRQAGSVRKRVALAPPVTAPHAAGLSEDGLPWVDASIDRCCVSDTVPYSSRRESSRVQCHKCRRHFFVSLKRNVSPPPQHRTRDLAHALSLRGQVTCSQLQSSKYQRLETYILVSNQRRHILYGYRHTHTHGRVPCVCTITVPVSVQLLTCASLPIGALPALPVRCCAQRCCVWRKAPIPGCEQKTISTAPSLDL